MSYKPDEFWVCDNKGNANVHVSVCVCGRALPTFEYQILIQCTDIKNIRHLLRH